MKSSNNPDKILFMNSIAFFLDAEILVLFEMQLLHPTLILYTICIPDK